MKIRQFINEAGEFCAEITSDKPIFVNYDQANAMSAARGFDDGIDFFFNLERCPTPINQDNDADNVISDGIWLYDRLTAFIDWGQDDIDQDIMRKALMSSKFEA
jgi:hypothetical protein